MSEFEGEHGAGPEGRAQGSKTAQPASPLTPSPKLTPERKLQSLAWDEELSDEGVTSDGAEPAFKRLTRLEVQALVARHPPLSPWRVVGAQAVSGLVIAVLWWLGAQLAGNSGAVAMEKMWSALCGVAAVVLPNALMAWGMTGLFRGIPGAAVLGFMFWELIKIMLAVAMLAAAAKWMPGLYWPALLVGLIGCLKVNWVALLLQGRFSKNRVAASHAKRDGN